MTDTTPITAAPQDVAWRDIAPWPGSPTRDLGRTTLAPEAACKALAGHFATMAWVYLDEYGRRMSRWREHCDACAATLQPAAGQHLRDLIRDYLEPGIAAFTAAGALLGRSATDLIRIAEDGQLMHELTWDWMPEAAQDGVDGLLPASAPIPADVEPGQLQIAEER